MADKLKSKQAKEWAKSLFLSGVSQKAIAKRTGYTEKTIGRWVEQGNWRELKMATDNSVQKELPRLLMQLKEFNDHIESKPEGKRFGSSGEYDALNKLKAAIAALDKMPIHKLVSVLTEFIGWVDKSDHDLAMRLSEQADAFIKSKI